jgi:hypothetical protein
MLWIELKLSGRMHTVVSVDQCDISDSPPYCPRIKTKWDDRLTARCQAVCVNDASNAMIGAKRNYSCRCYQVSTLSRRTDATRRPAVLFERLVHKIIWSQTVWSCTQSFRTVWNCTQSFRRADLEIATPKPWNDQHSIYWHFILRQKTLIIFESAPRWCYNH